MDEIVRAHVVVSGRVQGVWFRAATRDAAQRLEVSGWVRNRADGRVEAVFEGPRPAVEAAVAWCHEGPDHASVSDVLVSWEQPEGSTGFQITGDDG